MAELMYKIANEEAADIRIIRPELSDAVANVVALALSKRPETRYQTGDAFAADLRAAMAGNPVGAAPTGPAPIAIAPAVETSATAASEKTVAFSATVPGMQATPPRAQGGTDLEI
jgi:eukaryotic-like serine/threonine-protein kinase